MLKLLQTMPPDIRNLPLPDAILEFLMRRRRSRKWRWSTTLKYLATAQGALSALPLYKDVRTELLLSRSKVWVHGMKATARRAREELPNQPQAATWSEVQTCLRNEPNLLVFCAILLSWLTAARTGCTLQLARNDVQAHEDGSMSVRFVRGKSVLLRGSAYTVHTPPCPPEFLPRLQRLLSERHSWLFPRDFKGSLIKDSLRRGGNTALEQRSLRRGSIQALATAPNMTDELLMLFSGHQSVNTLRRYLNWGVKAVHTRLRMVNAAATSLTTVAPRPVG